MHLVGLDTYCGMMHGAYNVKLRNTCFEISVYLNTVQRTLWRVVTEDTSTVRKLLTVVVTVTKEKRIARRNIEVYDKTG